MNKKLLIYLIILFIGNKLNAQQLKNSEQPWKGNAILGNGNICVVYSDDQRIYYQSGGVGIQHLYFNNYTVDYVASSEFNLYDDSGNKIGTTYDSIIVGMKNYFTASTKSYAANNVVQEINCFVLKENALVISLKADGITKQTNYKLRLKLRKSFVSDRITSIKDINYGKNYASAVWSNNVSIVVGAVKPKQNYLVQDSVIMVIGAINPGERIEIIISVNNNLSSSVKLFNKLSKYKDLSLAAEKYWDSWLKSGFLPVTTNSEKEKLYLEYYKRNLYAANSANLNGQIPADITGQFLTNNMPQLYPRDAMMVARVFLLTGHYNEAKQVINFWKNKRISKKSKGEFFARYDAYANAVDGGSGARYDEPEWDANGYMIQLAYAYYEKKRTWLIDKKFIYELADFLTNNISANGLLYEGGIVEWTGFLPSTNMICAATLETASKIALVFGDKKKQQLYSDASKKISLNLEKMFDKKRNTYASVRFYDYKGEQNKSLTEPTQDTVYLWDTSTLFGVVWGYPDHEKLESSYNFYFQNTMKQNGGMQYFDSRNPGLAAYGHDLFFFTTAAAAYYQLTKGDIEKAEVHLNWMIKNSNIYGLMPERIYLNQSDCSPASPLSWCCAELAGCLFHYFKNNSSR